MREEQWTEPTRSKDLPRAVDPKESHLQAGTLSRACAEPSQKVEEAASRDLEDERVFAPAAALPPPAHAMPVEDPAASLLHLGNGRPCRYFNAYNGACLNGPLCAFQHAPDEFSLRLSPSLGNFCEAQIVRIGGCTLGTRCWYSHDLENGAGFPVDDAWALKETLERIVRMRKDERRNGAVCWGGMVKERREGATVMVLEGKCGDEVLKELGGRRPMGKQGTSSSAGRGQQQQQQQQWQHQARVQPYQQSYAQQRETEEDERMENMGWTNDQMNELASYGIKPWEHDDAYVSPRSVLSKLDPGES